MLQFQGVTDLPFWTVNKLYTLTVNNQLIAMFLVLYRSVPLPLHDCKMRLRDRDDLPSVGEPIMLK